MKAFHTRIVLALVLLGLAGCSTVNSRIREKHALFETLDPHTQEVVRSEHIAVGFTPDMVYMALGSPDEKREHHTAKGDEMTWIYLSVSMDWAGQVVHYRHYVVHNPKTGATYVVSDPVFQDVYTTDTRERVRVDFVNGKVVAFEREKRRR